MTDADVKAFALALATPARELVDRVPDLRSFEARRRRRVDAARRAVDAAHARWTQELELRAHDDAREKRRRLLLSELERLRRLVRRVQGELRVL